MLEHLWRAWRVRASKPRPRGATRCFPRAFALQKSAAKKPHTAGKKARILPHSKASLSRTPTAAPAWQKSALANSCATRTSDGTGSSRMAILLMISIIELHPPNARMAASVLLCHKVSGSLSSGKGSGVWRSSCAAATAGAPRGVAPPPGIALPSGAQQRAGSATVRERSPAPSAVVGFGRYACI